LTTNLNQFISSSSVLSGTPQTQFFSSPEVVLQLSRILVPVDFSDHSRKALDWAMLMATPFNAAVEVLYVWQPPTYLVPDVMLVVPGFNAAQLEEQARGESTKSFEEFRRAVKSSSATIKFRFETGRPAAAILRVASEGVDMIVMGTHGRTGLERVLMGSVANEVVTRAGCPVVTVRS